MKKVTVVKNKLVIKRRELRARILPTVRKLVDEYGFSVLNGAIKALNEERRAIEDIKNAEENLAQLKAKLK